MVISIAKVYEVQIGRYKGSYKTKYKVENGIQAVRLYEGINIGRGFKKRLLADGKVVVRSSSD